MISPLAQKVGRSSVIFWSLVLSAACCIWSAEMTKRNQYGAFVAASVLRGIFSATPAIAGTRLLIDLFYLHERGKAFAFYTLMFMLGILAGPTFSGFIVEHTNWPVEFWWGVASQGFMAILVFVFLEETGWTRDSSKKQYPVPPQAWLSNRIATYFPGTKITPYISAGQVVSTQHCIPSLENDVVTARFQGFFAFSQVLIGLSPVGLIVGFYQLINFGWFVMINTLLAVFLENPIDEGGYAFTPQQNAACKSSIDPSCDPCLTNIQSPSRCGLAFSWQKVALMLSTMGSRSGFADAAGANGSQNIGCIACGSPISYYPLALASSEPGSNTTCITWCSRSGRS